MEKITVRPAKIGEVDSIYDIIHPYVQDKILLPREKKTILEDIKYTWVAESSQGDNKVIGTITLVFFSKSLCEVRALAIQKKYHGQQIGSSLIKKVLSYINTIKINRIRIFALTYNPTFFLKHGFKVVPKHTFPEKIYEICQYCDKQNTCEETAVALEIIN